MSELSFCAKLNINPNLYEKIPKVCPNGYPDSVIKKYTEFLELPKIKQMSDGDVIEISRVPYGRGYGVKLSFESAASRLSVEGGVFNSKNEASLSANDLIFQTIQFLGVKYGIEQKMFERHIKYIQRVFSDWNKSQNV